MIAAARVWVARRVLSLSLANQLGMSLPRQTTPDNGGKLRLMVRLRLPRKVSDRALRDLSLAGWLCLDLRAAGDGCLTRRRPINAVHR
jgi:hypothetical protein